MLLASTLSQGMVDVLLIVIDYDAVAHFSESSNGIKLRDSKLNQL